MSWITVIWSMAAGVSLALAAVHMLVWLRDRRAAVANLLFSVSALAAAVIAMQELALMRSQTPADYAGMLRWMHVSAAAIVVAIVWFIRCYLGTGRLWLAWLITVLRGLILVANFLPFANATFIEVKALRQVSWLGETLSAPVGEASPWRYLVHISMLLLVVFVLDAANTARSRGKGRQALCLGAAIVFATALAAVFAGLMVRGVLPGPLIALVYLIIIVAMAAELSVDLLRARHLARELPDSRERMRLAAQAADLGLWDWDMVRDEVWTNEVVDTRTGISSAEPTGLWGYLALVHPDDRDRVETAIRRTLTEAMELHEEYRMSGPDGNERWFDVQGRVEFGFGGSPCGFAACPPTSPLARSWRPRRNVIGISSRLRNARSPWVSSHRRWPTSSINPLARSCETPRLARTSCDRTRPPSTRSGRSWQTSAETISGRQRSSTECAPCCSRKRSASR